MGLEFQVKDDKVCYTPLKDKCEAIQNLDSPKTNKSILRYGQLPVIIFTKLGMITCANISFAIEIQEI